MSKPILLFTGPCGSRSGYGHHARDLVSTLIEMDRFDVKIVDLRWGGTPRNALKTDNPDHMPIIQRLLKTNQLPQQPEIHVHCTVPNEFQALAKFNIGVTAGMETTLCSPEWLQGLNRMNFNIVPSTHSRDVFMKTTWTERDKQNRPLKQLKNEKPVEVLFEGADSNVYHHLKKGDEVPEMFMTEMKQIDSSFNFLFVGHWLKGDIGQDRKDVGMLIKVFLESFKNQKNPPGLILKTSGAGFSVMDREEILQKLAMIKQMVGGGQLPPIYLLHGELTDDEMNALYNHPKVKAHITFTKGEGFGRPLLEASLSAKPIIASDYSGHLDFLNKPLATLLSGQLTHVHKSAVWDKVIVPESQWFTVNYNYASAVMKDVFKNYKKYELNAKKLAEINKTKFTRNKMKLEFEKILDKYLPEFPTETTLNLPNLPKLQKKVEGKSEFAKIKLPKLKAITAKELNQGNEIGTIINLPKLNEIKE